MLLYSIFESCYANNYLRGFLFHKYSQIDPILLFTFLNTLNHRILICKNIPSKPELANDEYKLLIFRVAALL